MKIFIPFHLDFRERMLGGQKTKTTRKKSYGKPRDTFEAFGATFELTDVYPASLFLVSEIYYLEEGFETPQEFRAFWVKLHSRRGYRPEDIVRVHSFRIKTAS